MVWAKTLETYNEMVAAEGWSTRNTVDIPTVQDFNTKIALPVIAKCGFGLPVEWSTPPVGPNGKITVQETVRILADSHIVALLMPRWVKSLPVPGFCKICRATEAFTGFMKREIAARSEEVRSGTEFSDQPTDTFMMLVRENEQETGKLKLSDQEVDTTTVHAPPTPLALLALHQEIQDEILEHILSAVGCDRDPIFSDYADLNKVLATFYEALRLFPPAYLMLRDATEDTVLNLPNPIGQD
ncbi:hypothetical protein DXG01_007321 [Tephrocybe rancida]|nr:hypothetical protein DXG01_007321 [Tephrocybe rancida]